MNNYITLNSNTDHDFWNLIAYHEAQHDLKLEMEKINREEARLYRRFVREMRQEKIAASV